MTLSAVSKFQAATTIRYRQMAERLAFAILHCAVTMQLKESAGPSGSRTRLVLQVADYAYAACGPQIFILRVSGIRNRLSTKHTAGTAIG